LVGRDPASLAALKLISRGAGPFHRKTEFVEAPEITGSEGLSLTDRMTERASSLWNPNWLPRPVNVALVLGVVAAGVFFLILAVLGGRELPAKGVHTIRAIEQAFNWVECGEFGALRQDSGIASDFGKNLTELDTSLKSLAERRGGTLSGYCEHEFRTWSNEDSSLFYFFSFLLKLSPGASLNQMYLIATALYSIIFVVTGYVIWRVTRSVFLSVSTVFASAGWYVIGTLTLYMSSRVFAWPLLLLLTILMAYALTSAISGKMIRAVGILVFVGLFAAFAVNMRSTLFPHIPLLLVALLVTTYFALRSTSPASTGRSHIISVAVLTIAFGGGYFGYQQLAIGPLSGLNDKSLTTHPVAHPLVLGLSVPPNELSADEGIAFADGVGFQIAERIEPGSSLNLNDYERVMWGYYFGLWQDRPLDMIKTYLIKAEVSGVSQAGHLRSLGIGWFSPLSVLPNGIFLGLLLLALAAWSYFTRIKDPVQVFLLRALLASAVAGYAITWAIHSTHSLYVLESPFSYILLTILFWWFVGKISLRYLLRLRSS